ncbi:MAG: glycoside hydrolase family 9 protein [Chitinispirillaceae bacterium]
MLIRLSIPALLVWLFCFSPLMADPEPYAPIANPLPDTLDQLYRDSATIQIGRVRVNQAGYRPQDKKYFYYVGEEQSEFSVIDVNSGETVATGDLVSKGTEVSGQISIRASNNAQHHESGDERYTMESPLVSGPLFEGQIPESVGPGQYRIRVGTEESGPFWIDEKVYSWLRDAAIKFPGVNRCGNSDSWFHPPCHLQDAVTGGWHDCGDHLKESCTQSFLHSMLGLAAAVFKERDMDHYGPNHNNTIITDGIPDILYEAKYGSDYLLQSYDKANGNIENLITSMGNFGADGDHGWWGRPEYQDMMPPERGGPPRPARVEIGVNVIAPFAAGLAYTGKLYEPFDSEYARKCLSVAKDLYSYVKNNPELTSSSEAYHAGEEAHDKIAFAAVALLWATEDTGYLNDLCYDTTIPNVMTTNTDPILSFQGGWFKVNRELFVKETTNTSWDTYFVPALWSFYRLILKDEQLCNRLSINTEERLKFIEQTAFSLARSLTTFSDGDTSISLPPINLPWMQIPLTLKYGSTWFEMSTEQDWMWNRYQISNIFDMYAYSDMALWLQGMQLPNTPATTDWKGKEVREIMIRQMDYMLGVNPWDISMFIGVGHKNFNHIHHRAANPEGKNLPGGFYGYTPPDGALYSGWPASTTTFEDKWKDHFHTETGIDASAISIITIMGLTKDEPITEPPTATVRTVYVGYDRAIIEIRQSRFGNTTIQYGSQTPPSQNHTCDSAGVFHRIVLNGLQNGTTYYFDAVVSDLYGNSDTINDRGEYFEFTTLQNPPGDAEITNVKVCKVTSDSAEIFWYTPNGEYNSRVVFGETQPPETVHDGNIYGRPTNFHYVKIGDLKEKTTYYFYVESDGMRDDNEGKYYTFTTPVEHVDFDVRIIQYEWGDKPTLGMNVINQDSKAYDSLEMRFYMRGTEEEMADMGARVDIGFKYRSDGWIDSAFKQTVDDLLQDQKPIKIPDTYDPSNDTYAWYFAIPTGSTVMESGARFRLDVVLVKRNLPFNDDLLDEPPTHIPDPETDWSWMPHYRADGDPVDYGGIPEKPKTEVDQSYWTTEINPYVTVYRKNEFVWGYSPSTSEQQTKKNNYEMTAQITSPLHNPSEEYIFMEQVVPSITVKGWAEISEDGVINDIWVNGKRIRDLNSVAQYDFESDRYNLTIPVPVENGGNNVDITIFGGPELNCEDCFGCAFSNHSFYVEFRGAEAHPSHLSLRDLDDNPLQDTARIDTTVFNVVVDDMNGNLDYKAKDTVTVSVVNPVSGDSIYIPLLETGDSTGIFKSIDPVSIVSLPPDQKGPNQISMSGGDVVWITYVDQYDPSDISKAYLATRADFPIPVRSWFKDTDGNGSIDRVTVRYSTIINTPPDSLHLDIPGVEELRVTKDPDDEITTEQNLVHIDLNPSVNRITGFRTGDEVTARTFLLHNGSVKESVVPVADSAGPALLDRAVLFERLSGQFDTLQILLSEPVSAQKAVNHSLSLRRNGEERTLPVLTVLDSSLINNSLTLLIHPDDDPILPGDSIFINPTGPTTDRSGNAAHPENMPVPVILKTSIPRVISGLYRDGNGDGKLDLVDITFNKDIDISGLQLSFSWDNGPATAVEWSRIEKLEERENTVRVNIEGVLTGNSIVTGGSMRLRCTHNKFPGDTIYGEIADSAAPVIKKAVFAPSLEEGKDTLVIHFSEQVPMVPLENSFHFKYGEDGTLYNMALSENLTGSVSQSQTLIVSSIEGIEFPGNSDSVWINTETEIFDMNGVIQNNENNRRCKLDVKPVPYTIETVVAPNPFTINKVNSAGFKGTRIIVRPVSKLPVTFTLSGSVTLYDALGNIVRVLENPESNGSDLTFNWDGYNRYGRQTGSGTYLAVVEVKREFSDEENDDTMTDKVKVRVSR